MNEYTIAGHAIDMGATPEGIGNTPLHPAVTATFGALTDFDGAKRAIEGDPNLTEIGRAAKLAPLQDSLWETLVAAASLRTSFANEIDRREVALLAIPKLDPAASAVAVEDAEARAWWRGLDHKGRADVLRTLANDDPEGVGFERYGRLWLALLRSPIPLPDRDLDVVRSLWERDRRAGNPAEAAYIERGRAALAWFDRAFGQAHGVSAGLTGWGRGRVAEWLASNPVRTKHAGAFGFSPRDMANAEALLRRRA